LLLLLLGLIYVPTAAVWAVGYAVGPGFAVGVGTSVTMSSVHLGAVPAFPMLAALPDDGAAGGLAYAALLVPLAGGVVAGLLVDRSARRSRGRELSSWRRLAEAASAAGAVAGLGIGALALLASGPAGPGRLAEVGPPAVVVGLAVAVETAVLAMVTLAALRLRRSRRPAA
jgi:hypothetical protein